IIAAVDVGDEAIEVWAGAEDALVTGEVFGNNVKTKVEVYRVNRGGTWNYIFVNDVFDWLYADGSLHRFMQQVVFGKAVYQFLKKHDIRPDILHLNETPPVVTAMLMRADDSFDDTAIVYTNHTLVPAGFHDQRFSCERIGLDVNRMEYLLGLHGEKVGTFREYFLTNGDTMDFCYASMKLADIINAVSDEHAGLTVKLFRDEYGVDLTDKVIGVLNGSGEEWVSDDLKSIKKEGRLPTADELWNIREKNKAEVYDKIEKSTGVKLDPKKFTSWAVRRIVEYKSQYPVLRFLVHVMCSSKETVFTRESLRELWKRDIPDLLGANADRIYNADIEKNAEHVLDMLFDGKEEINGRDRQLVLGGPGYETAWVEQFRKWMWNIPEINGNVVFLENYGPSHLHMQAVAADNCINMPRQFDEACGTSDGRGALNGGVNIALMGAGPIEWMTEYDEETGKGSGFFVGPYTRMTEDGVLVADLESFYKNMPFDVFGKIEKASELFERPDKMKWKQLMLNAFMDSTFGLEKKAVTDIAMEERYAKLVYLNAIAERRGVENTRTKERTLFEQLFEPDVEREPAKYTAHKIAALISENKGNEAIKRFFTGAAFLDESIIDVSASLSNYLIERAAEDKKSSVEYRKVLRKISHYVEIFSSDNDIIWSVQNIVGQTIGILSAIEEGVEGAEKMRVTIHPGSMLKAADKDRGRSFIDERSVPEKAGLADTEGMPGPYDRGYETLKKLGDNILDCLVYNRVVFEKAAANKEKFTMYRMVHGLIAAAKDILNFTKKGFISTFHKTIFLSDFVPGSYQTTSTGPGHFQGLQLDVKQVTSGKGIQFNVKYDSEGNMVKVIAQYIKEGDFFFALPGCVDYMVNLGGLEFSDFSVKLSPEIAAKFNPDIDFEKQGILENVSKNVSKKAPFVVGIIEGEPFLVSNMKNRPPLEWIGAPDADALTNGRDFDLAGLYKAIKSEYDWNRFTGVNSAEEGSAYNAYQSKGSSQKISGRISSVVSEEALGEIMKRMEKYLPELPSLDPGNMGIMTYMEESSEFLSELQEREDTRPKLIRLPIEILNIMDKDDAFKLIDGIQRTAYGHVELYSSTEMITPEESQYIVAKKELPEGFIRNRSNTMTLIPITKRDPIQAQDIAVDRIGGIRVEDTIILPTGISHDTAGVARNIILGLRLSEILGGSVSEDFLDETLAQYKAFCEAYGIKGFDMKVADLNALIRGTDVNDIVIAINKLIRYMPITPLNTEEVRDVYERIHEVLTKA
ncbi:MAG: glycogen/starch synthase, partial [Candidatus Omnitrophica bacterium]|nr:glycogen/starch synthase [Candidatus Omnitrophota bacterium]